MKMQRIHQLFRHGQEKNSELASLLDTADHLSATQKVWNEVIPQAFKPYTRAGSVEHKRLTVFVEGGAVAAKIKLMLPTLLVKLQKKGLDISTIRVRVSVNPGARKPQKTERHISPQAAESLGELADKLSGTALGEVLNKLARR